MAEQKSDKETSDPKINIYGYNTIAKHIGQAAFVVILLFLGAGSLEWFWGWIFAIVYTACWLGLSIAVAIANPALLNKRGQRVKDATKGTKTWDLLLLSFYFILILVQPFVAGLDWRNSWSATASPLIYILGNALMILGFVPLAWAMIANDFFEPSVRIQGEAHQVETAGPYCIVRHPSYVGIILQFLALPIALGTWVAFILGVIGTIVFIIRTALEDRTLQEELPGYAEYAQKTRYRLIPLIW